MTIHIVDGEKGTRLPTSKLKDRSPKAQVSGLPSLHKETSGILQEIQVRAAAQGLEWGSVSILGPSIVKVIHWCFICSPLHPKKPTRDKASRIGGQGRGGTWKFCLLFRLSPSVVSKSHASSPDPEWCRGQLMCHLPWASMPLWAATRVSTVREAQAAYLGEGREDLLLQFETMKVLVFPPGSYHASSPPPPPQLPLVHITTNCSLNKHLLSAFFAPGTKPGAVDTKIEGQSLPSMSLQSGEERDQYTGK